ASDSDSDNSEVEEFNGGNLNEDTVLQVDLIEQVTFILDAIKTSFLRKLTNGKFICTICPTEHQMNEEISVLYNHLNSDDHYQAKASLIGMAPQFVKAIDKVEAFEIKDQ